MIMQSLDDGNSGDPGESGKEKRLSRKWIIAGGLAAALGIILLLLPFALELGAERFLTRMGARSARIMDVDFNPFLGKLVLHGIEVAGPGSGALELELLETRVNFRSLFRKRINIVHTGITGLRADIRRQEDGSVSVAGFPFGPGGESTPEEDSGGEKKPWGFGSGGVEIGGVRLHLSTPEIDDILSIRHLRLGRFATWSPEEPGDFSLLTLLGETSLELSGTAKPFADERAVDLKYDLADLPLGRLEPFLPPAVVSSLSGRLGAEGSVTLRAGSGPGREKASPAYDRSVSGTLSLTLDEGLLGAVLGQGSVRVGQQRVAARMEASYSDTGAFAPENLKAAGDLTVKGFSVAQEGKNEALLGIRETTLKDFRVEGPGNVKAQNLALQGIRILSRPPGTVREGEPSHVASLESLILSGLSLSDMKSLQLGEITLDSLSAWILRQEGGSLEAAELLPETEPKEAAGEREDPQQGEEAPRGKEKGGLEVAIGKLALTGENVLTFQDHAGQSPLNMKADSVLMEVTGFKARPSGEKEGISIQARGNLNLGNISISGGQKGTGLLEIAKTDVNNLRVEGLNNVSTEKMTFRDLSMLSRPGGSVGKGEPPAVASLKSLTVRDVSLREMRALHMKEITLESLSAWILRKEGGSLEAMELLPKARDAAGTGEGSVPGAKGEGGVNEITLDRLALSGENVLTFKDREARPPVTMKLDSLKMEITDFKTGPSGGQAALSLEAGMGKYTSLDVQGKIRAPWDNPDLDGRVVLKSFDLPPLTPYTDRYLGYVLSSGHLNMDMDIRISGGTLDSETEIVVNRIKMTPVKEEAEQKAGERLGIPVKTALSLLKDKNDNVELSLPVEGDLNDPNFELSDVILKVTGNALEKGVGAYYQSLGVTFLTGGLIPPGTFTLLGQVFKGVATVSFDPLVFDPLVSGLSAEHEKFLEELAVSLTEKPDSRLIIIGKVTNRDIMALRRQSPAYAGTLAALPAGAAEEMEPAGMPSGVEGVQTPETDFPQQTGIPREPPSIEEMPLTDWEREELTALAKERAENVKDFLVEKGGLDPERLFILYSEVEKEAGGPPPRVELSI